MLRKIALISSVPAAVALAACSGSVNPVGKTCYEGSSDGLGQTVDIKLNIKSFQGIGIGLLDIEGNGMQSFSCEGKTFQKMGQGMYTDFQKCLPGGVKVPSVKYCSDTDTLDFGIQYTVAPAGIQYFGIQYLSVTLKKVACSSNVSATSVV